jgi:hypothetical protein
MFGLTEGEGIIVQLMPLIAAWAIFVLLTWRRHMDNLMTWATTQRTRLIGAYQRFQRQQHRQQYNATTIPGTTALAHPPASLDAALTYISNDTGIDYDMVIGWQRTRSDGMVHCLSAPLVGDVYHTLITGMSRAGKDNLALNAMIGLALSYRPDQVQFCIIDGKGLDFVGFDGKAHTWHLALKPSEIAGAMEALSAERERRADVLRAARVAKWESYKGGDMPLLVVYISELSLLEGAVGKRQLGDWLNQELAAGAAFGLRYIVATQTASNFDTRWRSQISLYLASFQPSQSQDQPNTGLTTNEIKKMNGIPPSELPAPPKGAGVFLAVQGKDCDVVRSGYMDDNQREALLDRLPERCQAAYHREPINAVPCCSCAESNNGTDHDSEPLTEPHGTAQEPTWEPELAETVRALYAAGWSRTKIAREIVGGRKQEALETVKRIVENV